MKSRYATALTVAAVLIAIGLPIFVALLLATRQAREGASQLALSYARDVVYRADATGNQVDQALRELEAESRRSPPCSPASLAIMKKYDFESSYLKALGHVSGTHLDCASADVQGAELGPVNTVQPTGVKIRYAVEFPFARGVPFIVLERNGFAAIILRSIPIDVSLPASDLSLATFTKSGHLITSRGYIDPGWARDIAHARHDLTLIGPNYVVAVIPSHTHAIGSVAALPIARVDAATRAESILLLPVGAVAGLILAFVVLYLARMQRGLPSSIKAALRRREFFVVYQPIVDLQSGRWIGAEALIRWRRPNGKVIRPDLFIPIAEDTGLIQGITEHVVQCVTRDAPEVFRRNPDFRLSINLSATDLHAGRTVQLMHTMLADTGARSGSIVVEVTERGFSKPQVASAVVRDLRAAGIRVAIDDFGTGYSSLSYLENFQLDYLKIDKSFIDTVGTQAPTNQVVVHIIEMAKSLKLLMVAEGVETAAQADFLRQCGVQYAQGWLFSKPLPFVELVRQIPLAAPGATAEAVPAAARRTAPSASQAAQGGAAEGVAQLS